MEDKEFYVISNGMVDIKDFVDFDCSEYGINEKVRFVVLKEILEQNEKKRKEAIKANVDNLIPKHIIKDDIFASINYINNLCYDVGNTDDIDHLGNRRIRSVENCCKISSELVFQNGAGYSRKNDHSSTRY